MELESLPKESLGSGGLVIRYISWCAQSHKYMPL